ncbi:bifunctional phosphoribosyl-AMP cyclohydrolase/phosphoribosyl-ATP diphosphatase HisIE [Sediminicola luteus]|uniref:Histidine biosynthesis bifunctional protein HisIE n=1 Tax=Sediminicola luteus TaxID=319238 RepID=A0A2A4G7I3_9FLAO|nr:bifunctional phosphoribosyl-AMP cyclohydrolase/phosphoribosyl-ATP diphosphatase HisIE [Sediminicola luteus]PCE63940.1 bifunctional phosphoribosyl-AMP cyclohydrolase/phosphoribosyl-ATP diphosphatase [Sediminicola luteus]
MNVNFQKYKDGLVPAIIQDVTTKNVLMLGYMDAEALAETQKSGKATFYSRSKQRLWTKGESSENYLLVADIKLDCDQDALLIKVHPQGPTCHKGTDTCWAEANTPSFGFISKLEEVIAQRKAQAEDHEAGGRKPSYVSSLFQKGINKVAQKVGEEAVETVIEAMDTNDHLFLEESSDLLFHYLILLQAKGYSLADIEKVLEKRHRK